MWLAVPAVGSRASSSSSSAALEPPEDTYIPPHPRPLLRRPVWASLDGLWDHVVLPANASSVAGAQVVLTSDGAPIRVPAVGGGHADASITAAVDGHVSSAGRALGGAAGAAAGGSGKLLNLQNGDARASTRNESLAPPSAHLAPPASTTFRRIA